MRVFNQIIQQFSRNKPLDPEQVLNSAGGFVWQLDPWQQLDRFLILGTEGGTFYIGERRLTLENAVNTLNLLKENGPRVVQRVVDVSVQGRAYKNDPALFVLALAFAKGDAETRKAAESALNQVARTGSHLFTFLEYANSLRGWGRSLRRATRNWYQARELPELAYQVTKYRQREGWTHRDALRLAHPATNEADRNALYHYITQGSLPETSLSAAFEYLQAVETLQHVDPEEGISLIRQYRLPREVVPTEWLQRADVWEALLPDMPMTALIRNLATLSRVGLITPLSKTARFVIEQLSNSERLRKARIHPIQVLAALSTYKAGRGARGQQQWEPVQSVVDALDDAFYQTFENVQPSNKRIVLALDVSGSMGDGFVNGVPGLSPRVASAALALVTASTESNHEIVAFGHKMEPVDISPRQRLDSVIKQLNRIEFGATDCALPMLWAMGYQSVEGDGWSRPLKYKKVREQVVEADAFVIYTDSETWYGNVHPYDALNQYRQTTGIPARMVVVGMTANNFTIANPNDPGMLDVVGFSTDTPSVISEFVAGNL